MFRFVADHQNKKILFVVSKNSWLVKRAIRQAFHEIGKDLTQYAKAEIKDDSKKHGRFYTRSIERTQTNTKGVKRIINRGRSIKKRASAPGEFPANWTGDLQRSIDFNVISDTHIVFGAKAPYAIYLEEGTSKMQPRPFLKMSLENRRGQSINHLETEVKKALNIKR